jgi:hypothetical protein
MTTYTDITRAISRSRSHNEIVRVAVADITAAEAALAEAESAAASAGLDYGSTESNEGWECWATDPASERADEMVWRLDVRIA